MLKIKTKKDLYLNIVLVLFLLLVSLSFGTALSMDVSSLIKAENNEAISFHLGISGNVSEVSASKNVSQGTLVLDGSDYLFSWISNFDSSGYLDILFSVEDNESSISSSVVIARSPVISGLENVNINSRILDVSLETDLASVCKYDLSNKSFSSMTYTFKSVDDFVHEGKTPSLSQGTHKVHVICKSLVGVESKASFVVDVNLFPSADIILSPSSPLRAGIIEVEVIASEDLIGEPELKYYFDDDASPRSITLTGSGNRWAGFMVIQEADKRRIGTFTFKGVDKTNLVGTEITSGKIFIVDNYVPSRVSSFEALVESDRVVLNWKYLDELFDEIKEYKIYKKSNRGGVDYVHYLATTSRNYYFDYDVEYGEAYYYKVSAVNHAHKEGPLSNEVAITFIPYRDESSEVKGLASELRAELKDKISFVNALILDVDLAESKIQRLSSEKELLITQSLGLLSDIVASKNKLNNVVSELSKLESKDLSYAEFDLAVSKLIIEANNVLKDVPLSFEIVDSVSYQETHDSFLARNVFEKYLELENFNLSRRESSDLLNYLVESQSSFLVDSEVIRAVISYSDREESVSLVSKNLQFFDIVDDLVILDNVLSLEKDVVFVVSPVSKNNYFAKWNVSGDSKKVSYYSFSNSSFDDFKESKMLVFKQGKVDETKNLITGMVAKDVERSSNPLFVPLLIGLLSVLFLSVYYFKSEESSLVDLDYVKDLFDFKKLFVKKDDSHKKLDLEKPPVLVSSSKSVDDANLKSLNHVTLINNVAKELLNEEASADNVDDVDNVGDVNASLVSDKGVSAVSKEKVFVDDSSISEEVLDTLYDLKSIVEDIYYSKEVVDDFTYVSKVKNVRKKMSRNAPFGKEFLLCDGRILKNLNDLRFSLRDMSDDVFGHHVNDSKNDFYLWIRDVFGYKSLAYKVKNVKSKQDLFRILKF
ncbi:fibronectin type III domain-containing protein [Candidatus Woesearchaeota archaeon]|nr:fibronectin type III domain-containing protein [Candidatus Woesearchaeota archaeon]